MECPPEAIPPLPSDVVPFSQWVHLTQSNDPPSEAVATSVAAHLFHLRETILANQDQMVELHSRMNSLRIQHAQLCEHHRRLESITSPLRTVPSEILVSIFKTLLLSGDMDRAQRQAFVVVRSVCRKWRDLIYTTAVLWARLSIRVEDVAASPDPQGIPKHIRAWFDRAKDAPLTFKIILGQNVRCSNEAIQAISEIYPITAEDRRWETLEFPYISPSWNEAAMQDLYEAIGNAPHRPWKNVQSLTMSFFPFRTATWTTDAPSRLWPWRPPGYLHQDLPALQHLGLELAHSLESDDMMAYHPGVQTLKVNLNASSTAIPSMYRLLQGLPNLRKAVVWQGSNIWPSSMGHVALPIHTHMHLQSLVLHNPAIYCLKFLAIPHLQTLELTYDARVRPILSDMANALLKFLECSQCHLRELHLGQIVFEDNELNRILRSVSKRGDRLEKLSLFSLFAERHLVEYPMREGEEYAPLLFPAMRHIKVMQTPMVNPDLPRLIRWAEYRKAALSASTTVHPSPDQSIVDSSHPIDVEFHEADSTHRWTQTLDLEMDKEDLKQLLNLGVRIITYSPWNRQMCFTAH